MEEVGKGKEDKEEEEDANEEKEVDQTVEGGDE